MGKSALDLRDLTLVYISDVHIRVAGMVLMFNPLLDKCTFSSYAVCHTRAPRMVRMDFHRLQTILKDYRPLSL